MPTGKGLADITSQRISMCKVSKMLIVFAANGVQMMVALLKRDNNKLLTILTDCLRILAMRHQPTKMIILQGGGPHQLVEVLKKQTYKNLILMTARLLKV